MTSPDAGLDLNLLRYLAVLVQEGSVTRAAERLDLTQPAMSAALKRLRQSFDDPILVRSGQTMTPTPYALELATRIAPMLEGVRDMVLKREAFQPLRAKRVFTLMGTDYVQFFMLPGLCARLDSSAPNVSIEHRPANPKKVEAWMESGQVDLGIGYLPTPPESLRSRLLFSDEQVCIVRKGHAAARSPFTADVFAELAHVLVVPTGANIYAARVDALLRTIGIRRRVALQLPSFLALPYVVAKTEFVGTIPRRLANYFAGLLPLEILKAPMPLPAFEISMFWHERVHTDLPNVWLRSEVVTVAKALEA